MNNLQPLSMHGKTVLITNAGSRFGAACAQAAYAAGANLVLVDAGNVDLSVPPKDVDYRRTLCVSAKQSSLAEIQEVVVAATQKFGGIDIVLVNADTASHPEPSIMSGSYASVSRDLSLEGIWNTVRGCLPMLKLRNGHIHIISSNCGLETGIVNAPQKLPVLALQMYAKALNRELAESGASAGIHYPGWVCLPETNEESESFDLAIELLDQIYYGNLHCQAVAEAALPVAPSQAIRRELSTRRTIPFSLYGGRRNLIANRALNRSARIREDYPAFSFG